MKKIAPCIASLIFCGILLAAETELKTDTFRLRFPGEGKPASLALLSGEELLNSRDPGACLFLSMGQQRILLNNLTLNKDNKLIAGSADGAQEVVFAVNPAANYLAFRIEHVRGIPGEGPADNPASGTPIFTLRFELNTNPSPKIKARVRVTELDYMTDVQNELYGVRVHWDALWHRPAGEPLGGFALFVAKDDADEDDILLRVWAGENLPHPKVAGASAWTLERARQWIDDWQRRFADRSQMIVEGHSLDELNAEMAYAEKARIKEIYLFTNTWRSDDFWPRGHGNCDVNRKVFPNGEPDLRTFSDFVTAKGMRLNLHYVSGGIGLADPLYAGPKPDRRLASWGEGTLAKSIGEKDKEILFHPAAGLKWPIGMPDFFEYNMMRLEDEMIRVGTFEHTGSDTWVLKNCTRRFGNAKAAAHAAGTEAVGLVAAYGQNFVPDNDSTLLEEIALGYAGFINRCAISHTEFDGAEIHTYNGRWGYLKFATIVYQNLDRPVTAHDSTGSAPRCNFEYRLNSTRQMMRGNCRSTHGNWSAPVELASPSRVASTLMDANYLLSQGHLGGAQGLSKPEPMFGLSLEALKAHGLTEKLIDTLLDWKAVSRLLTGAQRAKIDGSFSPPTSRMPERSGHPCAAVVHTVSQNADGYQLTPVCVMTRKTGDIKWQQGQEHGPLSPRQYIKPGDEISLENPYAAQAPKFNIRVLWAFDPQGDTVLPKEARIKVAAEIRAADLFTAGNAGTNGNEGKNGQHSAVAGAPNILLTPEAPQIHFPDNAAVKIEPAEKGALRLSCENAGDKDLWELKRLPEWGCNLDLSTHRGIGMRVTGDGSGAALLFQIPGRDYVLPLDFTGTREIQIPNGEAAWASACWGWRMDTKRADYASIHWMKLGIGYMPPHARVSIVLEDLKALAEIPAVLENPVVHVGVGTLTIKGSVRSGQILDYQGGETASVYDENWNRLTVFPVEKNQYSMPAGFAPVSIVTKQTKVLPWLEVQFMTEGEAMIVPRK